MAEPNSAPPPPPRLLLPSLVPVLLSLILYKPRDFDVAPLPSDHSFSAFVAVAERHGRVLTASEQVGEGLLPGPEDLAYDEENGFIYTGCNDGWIRRGKLEGGDGGEDRRPCRTGRSPSPTATRLGLQGLLRVTPDQTVKLLANETEGLKFGITDGVDVASDGLIYFTDATYKYSVEMHMLDLVEARPHGRLMSFDPSANRTVVLARDLYFPNGVSLSPDQNSLIFCKTILRRCRRYHIRGEKRGTIDNFINNLPGFPNNIRYDREGRYWIALSVGKKLFHGMLFKYPILRKMTFIIEKLVKLPRHLRDSGVLSVTIEGEPHSLYTDSNFVFS